MTKEAIAEGKRKDESVVDEKRMRTAPRTRVRMDFNPKPYILFNQEHVDNYLMRHSDRLPSTIAVEFCSSKMDVKVEPPAEGVHFHPLILALGVSLPLIPFV